ncbi:hypothetical protein LX36DRAFT_694129 [Colletotrichum falcatum]|nr:hypothetical protein LX36DRAFT_694129 [Colletotrichum falcatum]
MCWIDVYLGPPDWITTDAGLNFHAAEFKRAARALSIEVKEVPIEAHHSIGRVERYYATLRRAYDIIRAETGAEPDVTLQLAVKAINDTAGLDGLVPTLLVFGAYPRITDNSPLSATITQRAETVKKAMEAVRQIHAKRQVNEALATRNGPNTSAATALPLQSKQGPFILLANDGTTCTVELPQGPRNFRITVVKPWHEDELEKQIEPTADTPANEPANGQPEEQLEEPQEEAHKAIVVANDEPPLRRRPGRPRKSQKDTQKIPEQPARRRPGRPRKHPPKAFIKALIDRGVFHIVMFNERKHGGIRIFKSRLIREVKGKNEGYADDGKEAILTQSPTIQRIAQRIILAFTLSLIQLGIVLWLRDITQAYTQSATQLNRPITFNGSVLSLEPNGDIHYRQKGQSKKLQPADPDSTAAKQQYVKQRARGAYIASICQPEACFDYSIAAQHQKPANLDRGLRFTPLDLATAKLFVFVNSSFANNNDLTSQLGFIVVLANKQGNTNVVHYSSTKCKRVTRSVLASEIYAMMPPIPTILCTDSYSLYECLVKLGTTKEKRLMIDIMALRQSYKRREIYEIQ